MWKKYDQDYCEGCKYFGGHSKGAKCCNYIFDEDKRRPCPPGSKCTVKVVGKDRKDPVNIVFSKKWRKLKNEQKAYRKAFQTDGENQDSRFDADSSFAEVSASGWQGL